MQLHPILQNEYLEPYNKIKALLRIMEILSVLKGNQCEEAACWPAVLSESHGEAFNNLQV